MNLFLFQDARCPCLTNNRVSIYKYVFQIQVSLSCLIQEEMAGRLKGESFREFDGYFEYIFKII